MADDIKISDWNEANLKMKRLHDIQERINFYKRDPKAFSDGKFHYEHWQAEVEGLYGEGISKYAKAEIAECDAVQNEARLILRYNPPQTPICGNAFGREQRGFIIDDKIYYKLLAVIEKLERLVKLYNDKHGLSTKNKDYSGLF
jgi:hypothetical protein